MNLLYNRRRNSTPALKRHYNHLMPQALTHFRWYLPANASAHGTTLDQHLLINLWIALGLLALAHLLLFAGIALRRRNLGSRHKLLLEYLPLAAIVVLYATLGVRSEILWAAQRFTGAAPEAMQVEVTGMQFAWYFRYPGPDATFGQTKLSLISPAEANPLGLDKSDPHAADDFVTGQLVLPVDREIDLTLHAQDVIHGFSVPELRLKQNAVPGQDAHIHFTAARPGDYAILCTQVCGSGHYRMNATLRVLPQHQFEQWLLQHENGAKP